MIVPGPSQGGPRRDGRLAAALLCASLLAAAAAYARVLPGEFQLDDERLVQRNPAVKDLGAFAEPGAWSPAARPLTTFTFALNYAAGRQDPRGQHAVNLALHLAAALLVFLLARRTLREAGLAAPAVPAALAAALFVVHPLQTESVSYLVQRAEVLASLLYLGALLLLLAAGDATTAGRRAGAYAGALLLAAAALAAKPVAATLPAAWVLHRLAFAADRSGPRVRGWLLAAAPFVVLSAGAAWIGLAVAAGSSHAGLSVPGLGPGDHVLTELRVVLRYLALLALPVGQNVDPDVAVSRSLLEPATLAAAAVVAVAVAGAVAALRRSPPARTATSTAVLARVAAFGLLWFLLLLLPTTLVPLADAMAEHRVYLASFGLFLAAAVALRAGAEALALPASARAAGMAILVAALAAATWARNEVWETRVALWTDAAARSPAKPRPFSNLGWARTQRGEHDLALAAYRRGLELGPDAHVRAEILRNMGSSLAQLGRHAEAAAALTAAAADPDVEADARALLAISDLELRLVEAAREQVARALRVDPGHGVARNTLGQILLAEGDPAAALEQFRIAVRLDPDSPARRFNVALALERLGRGPEACAAWREYLAVETAPAARARAAGALGALGCGAP